MRIYFTLYNKKNLVLIIYMATQNNVIVTNKCDHKCENEENLSFMTNKTFEQEIRYSGVDLNNSGYVPKNNQYLDKLGVSSYEVSSVTPVTSIPNGISKTLNGVCDKEYLYYAWECEHGEDMNVQGQDYSFVQTGLSLGVNTWNNGSGPTYLLKVDRKTNKIVLSKHLGDITGFKTTAWTDYQQAGDDVCRGPLCLYDGHIYLTGQGQKYHTIMKVRASDFKLVWKYETIKDEPYQTNNPYLNQAPTKMRNIVVIPPNPKALPGSVRSKPMVVAVSTSVEYGSAIFNSIVKMFGYISAVGHSWGWLLVTTKLDISLYLYILSIIFNINKKILKIYLI